MSHAEESRVKPSKAERDIKNDELMGAAMTRTVDEVTGVVIDAAMKLHMRLGPGLLESVYETILARDLGRQGLKVARQTSVAFEYEGMQFDDGLRVDLLVNDLVVVELKSMERLSPVHSKQVLTYLRLLNLKIGLLINFGAPTLKHGLHRIINNTFVAS